MDSEHVEIPQYGLNLQTIAARLSTKAKHIVFATTTPCPNVTTSYGRTNAAVEAYNAEAKTALASSGLAATDDLYSAVEGFCGVNYKSCSLQLPANVHFSPQGCEFLGEHVASTVLGVLGIGSV